MLDEREIIPTSRRSTMKLLGTVTASLVGVSGYGLLTSSADAVTSSMQADNVVISSNAGQLKSLHVKPDMNYEWNGLDHSPKRIDFYVEARLPNGPSGAATYEQIGTEGTPIDDTSFESSTTKTYNFQNQVDILSHSGIDNTNFEKKGGSWTKTTDVDLRVRTELEVETSGKIHTDTPEGTFTVELTNEAGSATGGGQANTGGSAN